MRNLCYRDNDERDKRHDDVSSPFRFRRRRESYEGRSSNVGILFAGGFGADGGGADNARATAVIRYDTNWGRDGHGQASRQRSNWDFRSVRLC